jgi:hypothetical protein
MAERDPIILSDWTVMNAVAGSPKELVVILVSVDSTTQKVALSRTQAAKLAADLTKGITPT